MANIPSANDEGRWREKGDERDVYVYNGTGSTCSAKVMYKLSAAATLNPRITGMTAGVNYAQHVVPLADIATGAWGWARYRGVVEDFKYTSGSTAVTGNSVSGNSICCSAAIITSVEAPASVVTSGNPLGVWLETGTSASAVDIYLYGIRVLNTG